METSLDGKARTGGGARMTKEGMTDKEIVDKLIELTDGTIDHFDLDDAMDLLYEIKRILSRREQE